MAFSFAGEKRDFVESVANLLATRFGEAAILYDKFHESEFAVYDLGIRLPKLYGQESDLIVPVLCPAYESKRWTGWEWVHIYGLLTKTDGYRVMPSRFEFANADGLSPAAGFVELDDKTPRQFATLILERLALNQGLAKDYYTKAPPSARSAPRASRLHNLPSLQTFFGRETELRIIADALDPESRTWGVLIDGPGGMGKTSLAVRAAYDAPRDAFEKIVFVSLKSRELDDDGVRDLSDFLISGLAELFNELARELNHADLAKAPADRRPRLLLDALRGTRTLLLFDNLESISKPERDAVFTFVKKLPPGCKAILTSRGRIGSGAEELILQELDASAALATLAKLAETNPVLAKTSEAERLILHRETGGNPLLLRWTAGQIGRGSCATFSDAIAYLRSCPEGNDPLEFIFGDLVDHFSQIEVNVLCALSYFSLPARVEHIRALAEPPANSERKAQTQLVGSRMDEPRREPILGGGNVERALKLLANRSLAVPNEEFTTFVLVPLVADFLRKKRPEAVAETGDRLEKRAYALIVENGFQEYDRFPALDAAWPTIAAALPRFVAGPNDRLQTVCEALRFFLEFTGRFDESLALSHDAEKAAIAAGNFLSAGWCAQNSGYFYFLRAESEKVLACAGRAEAHWRESKAGCRERATAAYLRGMGHELEEDLLSASAAYQEAVELWRALGPDNQDLARGLSGLADVQWQSGDANAANRDYHEALRIARTAGHSEMIAGISGKLAELALDREDWPSAENLAREALRLADEVGRQEIIGQNCRRLAQALLRQDKKADALPYARRAVELLTRLGLPSLASASEALAECES